MLVVSKTPKPVATSAAEPWLRPLPARKKPGAVGPMFDQKGSRARELAAHGKSLQEPRGNDEYRRQQSDRTIARHHRHQAGADRHQKNREPQRSLASFAVPVSAEKNRADRAREKRNTERTQRDQKRDGFVGGGKEHLGNGHGEIAVDQDLVELERIADRRSDDQACRRAGAAHRGFCGGRTCAHLCSRKRGLDAAP
jgi:hypothetical protein